VYSNGPKDFHRENIEKMKNKEREMQRQLEERNQPKSNSPFHNIQTIEGEWKMKRF
jgi:hypothetical protein